MTFAIFLDFPGLEYGLPKFHDFPWPGGTLVILSSIKILNGDVLVVSFPGCPGMRPLNKCRRQRRYGDFIVGQVDDYNDDDNVNIVPAVGILQTPVVDV